MDPPIDYDPLDAALAALQPHGAFLFRSELSAPWGLTVAPGPASFHIVEAGECWMSTGGDERHMKAGDLVVLPRGDEAVFQSAPGVVAPPVDDC